MLLVLHVLRGQGEEAGDPEGDPGGDALGLDPEAQPGHHDDHHTDVKKPAYHYTQLGTY